MKNKQKHTFLSYEADEWFNRNKNVILNYDSSCDHVLNLISSYKIEIDSILEIGCSAGYRLNAIKKTNKNLKVFGIEPSEKAIEYGRLNFPDISFIHGTADDLSCFDDESLDLVIVGFVLYVVDRNILLKVVAEIDRVLKNGGSIIIIDFFSEAALKNLYHHIDDFEAYSYKQNYDEIFTASKLFYLIDKSTYNHSTKLLDSSSDYNNNYSISLLIKDLNSSYK
jgi:ubiquinone/menaquinone biosynthesis C-methylase UbiE